MNRDDPLENALRELPVPPLPPDVERRSLLLARRLLADGGATPVEPLPSLPGQFVMASVPPLLVSAGLLHAAVSIISMARIYG